METKVTMPKIGKDMVQGRIVLWEKKPGDHVEDGDVLFVLNNDHSDIVIEAMASGTLKSILVEAGNSAAVDAELAIIDSSVVSKSTAAATPTANKEVATADGIRVLVIGGGPGGYVAAIRAAQLGAKVTLIEKSQIGGTCLNRGCMPTKAMLHTSEIYEAATGSADLGIVAESVRVNWNKVQDFRLSIIEKLTSGVRALMKANRITLVEGEAHFTGARSVEVAGKEYSADKVIIAAGSRPIMPPIPGLKESAACLDSTACLELDHVPESLLVIGGGVIGLELGTVYRRYGAKVTVIEQAPHLLPMMDSELSELLKVKLQSEGMEIHTGVSVVAAEDVSDGVKLYVSSSYGEMEFTAEKVLVCVGRSPAIDGLALEKANVQCENGHIRVNDKMETNVPDVYAVGDCTATLMLAHAAMSMGETAADNAMGGSKSFSAEVCPMCAYVGPEFAGVGFTEEQAKAFGLDYKVGRFPTAGNGRSLVEGHTDGMIKVLAGSRFGEILGVHILAPTATELIEEATLAIKQECTLDEFADLVHCHPTVAEAVRESALATDNRAIHTVNKKLKK